ncbi:hypothetical protein B0H19DRAFT_1072341 [Mycena capillaripes]|nr:hypothetical protein B0H19DRAFT_1072341 [Mycena capillaripes]
MLCRFHPRSTNCAGWLSSPTTFGYDQIRWYRSIWATGINITAGPSILAPRPVKTKGRPRKKRLAAAHENVPAAKRVRLAGTEDDGGEDGHGRHVPTMDEVYMYSPQSEFFEQLSNPLFSPNIAMMLLPFNSRSKQCCVRTMEGGSKGDHESSTWMSVILPFWDTLPSRYRFGGGVEPCERPSHGVCA